MAKKIRKVVVSEVYFNLLVDKANMLDTLISDDDKVIVGPTVIKDYGKLAKAFDKLPEGFDVTVDYEEPAPKNEEE
jgi:hypothetical protein